MARPVVGWLLIVGGLAAVVGGLGMGYIFRIVDETEHEREQWAIVYDGRARRSTRDATPGYAAAAASVVVGGLMLMASFAGSAGDAFNGMLLMLLAVLQLVWAMGWLVAGQRTIEGSRGAAQAMRVLAFADIAFVVLSVVVLGDTATRGVLGCAIDVYIIVTMFGGEASRWLAGRR